MIDTAAIQAERALIGCALLDPEKVMPECMLRLEKRDFETFEYGVIFSAMCDLYREGKGMDVVTVLARMGSEIQDEMKVMLLGAAESVPHIGNYRGYIEIILRQSALRRAKQKCEELYKTLDEGDDVGECQREAAELLRCFERKEMADTVSPAQGLEEFTARMQKPKAYIETGIETVDKWTYIGKGDYVIVGGRPSSGKTALTLQMMLHMARRYRAVYFSLETSPAKITDRLVANYAGIDLAQIKRHALDDEAWRRLDGARMQYEGLNFSVVQAAGWTVEQIRARALLERAEVIFIDYLGLLRGTGKTRYEQVTQISVDLHVMAQQLGIAVIALAQLNRGGSETPGMASLRDSGQIEQDADVIMMLSAPEEDDGSRNLIITKNKEGVTGRIELKFSGPRQRFYEQDTRY